MTEQELKLRAQARLRLQQQQSEPPQSSVGRGMLELTPSSAVRAITDIGGSVGNYDTAARTVADWLAKKAGGALGMDTTTIGVPQQSFFPTSQQQNELVESAVGAPLREPRNIPEEWWDRSIRAIPAGITAAVGGAGIPGVLGNTVIPAAGGLAAREGAKKLGYGSTGQTVADVLGTVGSSVAWNKMFVGTKMANLDDLRKAKEAAYQKMDQAGVRFTPEGYQRMVAKLRETINAKGGEQLNRSLAPKVYAFMDDLERNAQANYSPSLTNVDDYTKFISDNLLSYKPDVLASSEDRINNAFGWKMLDAINDFLDHPNPGDLVDSAASNAGQLRDAARGANKAFRQNQMIDYILKRAEQDAGGSHNINNAIRVRIKNFLNSPGARYFSSDQKTAMDKIARGGGLVENYVAKPLSVFAPTNKLNLLGQGLAGLGLFGPTGGMNLPVQMGLGGLGYLAKRYADTAAYRNALGIVQQLNPQFPGVLGALTGSRVLEGGR